MITSEEKLLSVEHYDRMIAWAEKRLRWRRVNILKMINVINEGPGWQDCVLCQKYLHPNRRYIVMCFGCPLFENHEWCGYGDSLHGKMISSVKWGQWIERAKKLRDFIANLPEEE